MKMRKKHMTQEEIDDRLEKAIIGAHLEKLVEDKGLDFEVGERGSALSGGQKQRVCIARIFMKDPKVLFFDEVTSALDPISEGEVMKALNNLMVGKTTFVIAHRLHTLTNIEKIYVLKDGKIDDVGNYQELLEKDGFFKVMWEKQQGEFQQHIHEDDENTQQLENDLRTLYDILEAREHYLPTEIVTILRQIKPKRHTHTNYPDRYSVSRFLLGNEDVYYDDDENANLLHDF